VVRGSLGPSSSVGSEFATLEHEPETSPDLPCDALHFDVIERRERTREQPSVSRSRVDAVEHERVEAEMEVELSAPTARRNKRQFISDSTHDGQRFG